MPGVKMMRFRTNFSGVAQSVEKMLDKPGKYDYTVESWKGSAHLRLTGGNPTRHLSVLHGLFPPDNNIGASGAGDPCGRPYGQNGRR
jgi:hypothetical protein